MSAGTFTILHFAIFLSSLLFGIADRHFDMSMGAFCMSTGNLLFYTLLFFLSSVLFGRHFDMSTGAFCKSTYTLLVFFSSLFFGIAGRHFGMSTDTFTILHYTIFHFQPWHVDGHIFFFTFYYFSFPLLFWHRTPQAVILACGRSHFGMSTGTFTILHFTIFPLQPTFWHRGPAFWHVGGHILHVDGHIVYFTLYYFSFPAYFLASRTVILTCRRAHFCMSTGTFTILHIVFSFLTYFGAVHLGWQHISAATYVRKNNL
jgi:hypothetical protein